ncbi:MAG: hypothetical protein ABR570_14305 [Burkholderiales bacterium]
MKTIVLAIASASVLAACATRDPSVPTLRTGGAPPFQALHPNVYVVSGPYLVVDQEPIVFIRDSGAPTIKWKLRDPDYKLERIEFQPDSKGNNPASGCEANLNDESESSCINNTSVVGTFKYTIRVAPKTGAPAVAPLDPTIVNR